MDQVDLEFPAAALRGPGNRLSASRLDLGTNGAAADVAVLDLGDDRPAWPPGPVAVWASARPPDEVRVFGYPLAERRLKGMWRSFNVAGPASGGLMQLDWSANAGTFPGHSGGPVIDAGEGALAGILVEGSERGRFDRYLPVTVIARVWPQLPRPWLLTGAEARSHFTRRSLAASAARRGAGTCSAAGRAALDRVSGWLTAAEPPPACRWW